MGRKSYMDRADEILREDELEREEKSKLPNQGYSDAELKDMDELNELDSFREECCHRIGKMFDK